MQSLPHYPYIVYDNKHFKVKIVYALGGIKTSIPLSSPKDRNAACNVGLLITPPPQHYESHISTK